MQRLIDQVIDATGGKWPSNDFRCRAQKTLITRDEFEARKAERQGKPDWGKSSDWAQWLAQDSFGKWWWYPNYMSAPTLASQCFINGSIDPVIFAGAGEVIGDWRDTLEQRPNHIGESDEKADIDFELTAASVHPGLGGKLLLDKVMAIAGNAFAKHGQLATEECFALMRESQVKPDNSADWYDYDNLIAIGYPKPSEIVQAFYGQNDGTGRWVECFVTGLSEYGDLVLETRGSPPGFDKWFTVDCKSKYRPLDFNKVAKHPWHEQGPEPSPELSFHLSNAFNELQASARLLPEDDPLRASIVSLAGGVSAVKEVA